jgi:hypothetical protein
VQLLWIIAAAAVLFTIMGRGNPVEGIVTAIQEATRGPRLTHSPADAQGYVADEPQDLADEAGYSLEAYSAGRMLASEEGTSDTTTQAAVVHALLNKAARSGKSLFELLTAAKNPSNRGHFGSQKDKDPSSPNFGKSDRYASTAQDPYDRDCKIAQQCMSGEIPDFTGGATNYDRPAGESNPDRVAADRQSSGLEAVEVAGADAGLRFWRPA